jgi:PiT family inorganic phosphate transporter
VRNDFNRVLEQLKTAAEAKGMSEDDKKRAKSIHDNLMKSVEYVPWWVRVLSALCLGIGTMVGYKRIVRTLGERLGNKHLVPAQGASAELVAAGLIGLPDSPAIPSVPRMWSPVVLPEPWLRRVPGSKAQRCGKLRLPGY